MHATLEDHIKDICPRCKTQHSKEWKDQFSNHAHYVSLRCDCGYEIFIKSKNFTSSINH